MTALLSALSWVDEHLELVLAALAVWIVASTVVALVAGPALRDEDVEAQRQTRRVVRR